MVFFNSKRQVTTNKHNVHCTPKFSL